MKEYYKFYSSIDEDGIQLYCKVFYSIHETPLFHFCAEKHDKLRFNFAYRGHEKTHPITFAKSRLIKIKKISKESSRFAFNTKDEAFEHFKWMKNLQVNHIKRKLREVEIITKSINDKSISSMGGSCVIYGMEGFSLPETKDFIDGNYYFN